MTPKFHSLKVAEVRRETEDTVSIAFEVPADLVADYHYHPGQYLTLRKELNGEDVRRSYSLCSAPYESEWRVAVKHVDNGVFSGFANSELKAGDYLDVMTPTGHFSLLTDPEHQKSYALFAAGSGVTPILAMIKSILHDEPKSDITFFYGNKGFASIIFREEIEALKNQYMNRLRVIHILSRESLGNKIQKGRIDATKCSDLYDAFLRGLTIDGVYVCGPEQMILGVKESMLAKGIDERAIHFELFTTPGSALNTEKEVYEGPNVHANVSVIIDGDQIDIVLDTDGENILDAAQRAGADLPFACKGGVCCTCKARVLEGTARMEVNYALEADEVEAGYILTCQSHPTSEKLVVSFDD